MVLNIPHRFQELVEVEGSYYGNRLKPGYVIQEGLYYYFSGPGAPGQINIES